MFARKRKKKWPFILPVILLLMGALGFVGYKIAASVTLRVDLRGSERVIQEYNTPYSPTDAVAVLESTYLKGWSVCLPVSVVGQVNVSKVESYAVAYRGEFLWLEDTALQVVQVVDSQPPVIELTPDENDIDSFGDDYVDAGYKATDNYDGDITHLVQRQQTQNVITYIVSDSSGNYTIAFRVLKPDPAIAPQLTLKGEKEYTVYMGRPFEEPGYIAADSVDGDLTSQVKISGTVDVHTPGVYPITYTVTDSYGSTSLAIRTITVIPAPQPETVMPEGKVIYLTFDDGPSKHTPKLLEILKKYDVKATFFVVDTEYIHLLKEISEQGHAIGVHTASHIYKNIYASEKAYFEDFEKIHTRILDLTGMNTTIMRFPGGSSNGVSSFNPGIMTRLAGKVTNYGLQYFDWNVNSLDTGGAKTAQQVYNNVIRGIGDKTYSVVLQHDLYEYSVNAVESIIKWGLENGYRFLPLDATSPTCHQTIIN